MIRRDFLKLVVYSPVLIELPDFGASAILTKEDSSLFLSAARDGNKISDDKKGLYITNWIAQTKNQRRDRALNLLTTTELNAAVIDVVVDSPLFFNSVRDFVKALKQNNVWCIARIVVCQNNHFAKLYQKSVLIRKSTGLPWSCNGSKAIDPASQDLWDYTVDMSKRAIDFGFDEVQYDYIRFPADCSPQDIIFPVWDKKKTRREVMRNFFQYLTNEVRSYSSKTILSVDVFGEAVLFGYGEKAKEEIGQFYEDIVDHFDVISPMVYPALYSPGSFGIAIPAKEPYKIIFRGLEFFVSYLKSNNVRAKLRPWLQYFSINNFRTKVFVDYDEKMILAERKALDDLGVLGFLYWDPNNLYKKGAIRQKPT